MSKVFRESTRNLMRDIGIVKAVAAKQSFRTIGKNIGLTGSRVHQLYKRTMHDIYFTAGLAPRPAPVVRQHLQAHPVMAERVLETYARKRGHVL